MNNGWWKIREKKPKTGPQYTADVPDLIIKNKNENVVLEDRKIPMEYFEIQHFYNWYQENFDYSQYVKDKRKQYKMQQNQNHQQRNIRESNFRRSNRFKTHNNNVNYKEYEPEPEPEPSDNYFSSSDNESDASDEDYIAPKETPKPKKNKSTKKSKSKSKKSNKNKIIGRKRKLNDIMNDTKNEITNEQNATKKKRIVSKSITKKQKRSKSKSKATPKSIMSPLESNFIKRCESNGLIPLTKQSPRFSNDFEQMQITNGHNHDINEPPKKKRKIEEREIIVID